ncbi:MAG: TetR/AcrR family transcriptional regulator [Beijerinckiaceae bacterium]
MRLTKDQAEANRRRILAEAGRLFRERGFEGISVAELMQDAGFTHGGFYNHFASKSDLMTEVTRDVLARSTRNLARRMENREAQQAFAAYIDHYLSLETRDNPGQSCPIATLGHDVIRQEGDVKRAFAQGLRAYLEAFAGALPEPNNDAGGRRARAIASLAALIGGLVMARAVAGEDEAFSQEILKCVATAVKTPSRCGFKSDI